MQFGFDRLPPIQRACTWSLLIFGAVMLVETPLTQVIDLGARCCSSCRIPSSSRSRPSASSTSRPTIFWFMFQAVFFFPLIEELFFRGFLLTFLKNYTSTWLAIVLSAGVFAFAHLNLGAALPLWFLGIVLGVAYEHTGSLLVPIGIHACFNLATGAEPAAGQGESRREDRPATIAWPRWARTACCICSPAAGKPIRRAC